MLKYSSSLGDILPQFHIYISFLASLDLSLPSLWTSPISLTQKGLEICELPMQGTNISHLSKSKPIFPTTFGTGQIMIFHQPRFPWNKGISLTKPPFRGPGRVRSRYFDQIWMTIMSQKGAVLGHCTSSDITQQIHSWHWQKASLAFNYPLHTTYRNRVINTARNNYRVTI